MEWWLEQCGKCWNDVIWPFIDWMQGTVPLRTIGMEG